MTVETALAGLPLLSPVTSAGTDDLPEEVVYRPGLFPALDSAPDPKEECRSQWPAEDSPAS